MFCSQICSWQHDEKECRTPLGPKWLQVMTPAGPGPLILRQKTGKWTKYSTSGTGEGKLTPDQLINFFFLSCTHPHFHHLSSSCNEDHEPNILWILINFRIRSQGASRSLKKSRLRLFYSLWALFDCKIYLLLGLLLVEVIRGEVLPNGSTVSVTRGD